eukprot:CAMPEP_0198131044 /NCGR_PEP_ID=MMETSP1442-20131203/55248_1 /TAXON_ID= /ORGANISM="Craspedostauros australis, Strain CCMP3328" /LENGTH=53 /DNA_ID=CAMNT_0043791773 /DNA_START=102 /DNA_END=263 /DNA_ORIENTATION=+
MRKPDERPNRLERKYEDNANAITLPPVDNTTSSGFDAPNCIMVMVIVSAASTS